MNNQRLAARGRRRRVAGWRPEALRVRVVVVYLRQNSAAQRALTHSYHDGTPAARPPEAADADWSAARTLPGGRRANPGRMPGFGRSGRAHEPRGRRPPVMARLKRIRPKCVVALLTSTHRGFRLRCADGQRDRARRGSEHGRGALRRRANGVATITLNDPGHAQRALAGAARRPDRAPSSAPARRRRCAAWCWPPPTRRRSPRAPTSAASRRDDPARGEALRLRALRRAVQADRRARQADRCAPPRGHVLAGALGIALGVRPDRGLRGRELRHARDQRRHVPFHDHGADLPQRAAQEGQRAAAAGRALERAGGAGGGHRQPRRARRGARRGGRRVGGEAGGQVAGDHAPGQGGDAPPARHAAGRRARLPARAAHAWRSRRRTSSRA